MKINFYYKVWIYSKIKNLKLKSAETNISREEEREKPEDSSERICASLVTAIVAYLNSLDMNYTSGSITFMFHHGVTDPAGSYLLAGSFC